MLNRYVIKRPGQGNTYINKIGMEDAVSFCRQEFTDLVGLSIEQLPVIDLEITADDIANGIPQDPCRCAVARAIWRLFGINADKLDVRPDMINSVVGAYKPHQAMKNFIYTFDNLGRTYVKPCTLHMTQWLTN